MTVHISARLAWHQDGWNGHICKDPASNVYCVGRHSYPGELIAEKRNLAHEQENAGQCCSKLGELPPCMYSLNAFGSKELTAHSDPPDFFNGGAERQKWKLKPSTICVWPYEGMYGNDVKQPGSGFDYDQRLENAKSYFNKIEPDSSLIFYYANYSNPLNQDDERRYVIVGVSRIKEVADIRFYDKAEERIRQKYGGGFIWQCDITSHYPDQGLRLPYHAYKDDPEALARIAFFPDNPRAFKFGTRAVSDDDALDLVERFLEVAGTLREMGDKNEDWAARTKWLQSLIAELWRNRGLYPGVGQILDVLGFQDAIPFWKNRAEAGNEKDAKDALFAFLDGRAKSVPGLKIQDATAKQVIRQWKLKTDEEQAVLRDVLPRFDLDGGQIKRLLSQDRVKNSIYSSLGEIQENPYIIAEEYIGDGVDDCITFSRIDHGMLPAPDLGGEPLAETDDSRRLRALCVEQLRRETKHTFVAAPKLIHDINHKMSFLPEWKSHQFTERYLDVDEEFLSSALVFRKHSDLRYVYLKSVYEAERDIEKQLRDLAQRPTISFKSPVTEKHWTTFLTETGSELKKKAPTDYSEAIQGQVEVCSRLFGCPVAVLSGGAGTGKTTVIKAVIKAIEKAHGTGTSFHLLAPTGKAADRIRTATDKSASTIHSFLAKLGWLNDNLTFKRHGQKREESTQTIIIDEASMLDLELAATLFRAINWKTVQRLILVGDPNQLPPIGRGKVFSEIIEWLKEDQSDGYGELQVNIRQMENRVTNRGQGILELAQTFVRATLEDDDDEARKVAAEDILRRIQEGGNIDQDLRAVYWKSPKELSEMLISLMIEDMQSDTGSKFDPEAPHALWNEACKEKSDQQYPPQRADYLQIISPYRGELFGTEPLNAEIQKHLHGIPKDGSPDANRILDGIMLYDKVIQFRNRPKSNPINAYNVQTKQTESVEVFNGELGFVRPHPFDKQKLRWSGFRLEHFQVHFSRKEHLWVGYGRKLGKGPDDRWLPEEKIEENLELAYAISVHKAQGSEFERVYFVVPKHKVTLLSPELFYTGITRAKRHCTLLIEEDISPLLDMRRRERSHLLRINASLFTFEPLPDALIDLGGWHAEGKIHHTLAGHLVRSKSEVIIANLLHEREIPFQYEQPLFAPDGTFYLPDFTITWQGEQWYWEHWGRMDQDKYLNHAETKKKWYRKFFPDRLVETLEGNDLTSQADELVRKHFGG